ncbi:MAG: 4Fe-4S binding protein, partial [Bacillota bacterium]
FARALMQLHDGTMATKLLDPVKDKKLFEMWQDFAYNEMYANDAEHAEHLPAAIGRIIPAYQSIKDLPDVQPWENARELLMAQEKIAVVPCACRWRTNGAGAPCKHTDEVEEWKCLQFGKSADYAVLRGSGKALTLEEAIKNSDKAEEDGLVKAWMSNDQKMTTYSMCQCCDDCCGIFQANNINNVPIDKIYARSRFAAEVNQDDCSGCQTCVDRCKFDAIEMVKQGKKYKAVVNEDKCYGCGVCVLTCEPVALKMKTIRPITHVPESVQVRLG